MPISAWKESRYESTACYNCSGKDVEYRIHEPADEAYEDYEFRCTVCEYQWWVDGIDA
jgi:hypothetical protein